MKKCSSVQESSKYTFVKMNAAKAEFYPTRSRSLISLPRSSLHIMIVRKVEEKKKEEERRGVIEDPSNLES